MDGTFRLGSVRVGIRTTSERLGEWLDEILAGHRRSRWTDPFYSLVVAEDDRRDRRGFHVLYRGIEPVVRTQDLGTLARAFLEEIESYTFRPRRDAIYLGASVVAGPTGTALIPATYASVLGVHGRRAAAGGLSLPGSLWTAIDPASGLAVPVRTALGVPRDAVERLTGTRHGATGDRLFIDGPTRLDAVCLIHDEPTSPVGPLSGSRALYRLAGASENLPALGGGRTLEGLRRMLEAADSYGIAPMRPQHTLEALVHLTSHGRPYVP